MPHIDRNAKYIDRSRELRRNLTRQEKHLWYDFLSKYSVRWYKQRNIYLYIVDFYCAKAHLIVEIDGNQHYTDEGLAYDEERTKILEQYGLQVLRFTNRDVDCRFDAVCQMIDQTVRDNIKKFDKFPGI